MEGTRGSQIARTLKRAQRFPTNMFEANADRFPAFIRTLNVNKQAVTRISS